MKIVVFSDSHRDIASMNRILKKENPDLIFHLGDLERDCCKLDTNARIVKVRGNCDHGSDEVTERFIECGTLKILLIHGHEYGVKGGVHRLESYAKEIGATVALYGHTHKQYLHKDSNLITMNPGVPSKSYGVIISDGSNLEDIYLAETDGML